MLKKKGFIILLGVLLLLNVSSVLAASGLDGALQILQRDFNIPELYDNYPEVIESLIYMTLFISLGVQLTPASYKNNRAGKTVFVVLGIMLGIATMLGFRRWNITLLTFGTYGGLILMLGLIWGVWKLFSLMTPKDSAGNSSDSAKAFFASFGILLGYYIANTITNGELSNFLGNTNNPFIASIFNLALVALFITMFISLIILLGSLAGKSKDSTTPPGEKKGFFKSLADGIRNVTNGSKNVYDAFRNIGIKEIPPELQEALNTVFAKIEGFSASVNKSLLYSHISEGNYKILKDQAESVNASLIALINTHKKKLATPYNNEQPHPNDKIGSVHAGMLVEHLNLLAEAHEKMAKIKVQ